jgi:BlaI family penicillinase repressor
MVRRTTFRLGDLQLRIMKVLWQRSEANVADVLTALGSTKDLAYTTIATMLRKMEVKGLVTHRIEGRTFVYRPRVREEEVTRTMADHLVDRVFEGSLTEVVSHLLSTREVSKDELETLEQLIAERKKGV